MIPFVITWACSMTFSYKTYQNYSKLTQFTTQACMKTLSRKLVSTYIAFSCAHLFFTVIFSFRGASHIHCNLCTSCTTGFVICSYCLKGTSFSVPSTSPRICYQTVSSACDISKVPARDWKRPDSLAGEARKDPRSTQHKSSSFSFFRYRCAYVQPLLQVNKLLELPEEGTTSFSLKV